MGCRSDYMAGSELEGMEIHPSGTLRRAKAIIDRLTRLLCALMRHSWTPARLSKRDANDLRAWSIQHKKVDAARRKRERSIKAKKRAEAEAKRKRDAVRASALSKLSAAERKAIGVRA